MLIDSMVPEAKDKAKDWAGLATVAGFALAAGLSLLGQEPPAGVTISPRTPSSRTGVRSRT